MMIIVSLFNVHDVNIICVIKQINYSNSYDEGKFKQIHYYKSCTMCAYFAPLQDKMADVFEKIKYRHHEWQICDDLETCFEANSDTQNNQVTYI